MPCCTSVPRIFNIDTSAPGGWPERRILSKNRMDVSSSASSSISRRVKRSRKRASNIKGWPFFISRPAKAFSAANSRLDEPTLPEPMRSWPSKYLATDQPLFSSCTRFSTGTFTSSKKISFTSCPPSIKISGRTVMPGVVMSISKKLMPSWRFSTWVSVRTRQKIQSP